MAFTEFIKAQITKKLDEYCSQVPEHVKHQLKLYYAHKLEQKKSNLFVLE